MRPDAPENREGVDGFENSDVPASRPIHQIMFFGVAASAILAAVVGACQDDRKDESPSTTATASSSAEVRPEDSAPSSPLQSVLPSKLDVDVKMGEGSRVQLSADPGNSLPPQAFFQRPEVRKALQLGENEGVSPVSNLDRADSSEERRGQVTRIHQGTPVIESTYKVVVKERPLADGGVENVVVRVEGKLPDPSEQFKNDQHKIDPNMAKSKAMIKFNADLASKGKSYSVEAPINVDLVYMRDPTSDKPVFEVFYRVIFGNSDRHPGVSYFVDLKSGVVLNLQASPDPGP